jgi:dTDP-4-dehydrorhamnose reductase
MAISPSGLLTEPVVWITGANGLIGSYLVQTAPNASAGSAGFQPAGGLESRRQDAGAPGLAIRALTRADFDLLDFSKVETEFLKARPQLLIHCAAISTVGDAQKNPEFARRVNVAVTRFLAELAHDISFVFFSTDLVFDGCKGNYTETDATNPLHVYGETKLAAEAIVLKNPRHLVVRTSLNGGTSPSGQRAFNEQLRRSLREAGQGMTLFTDEFRCPIPAVETARAVWDLAQQRCAGLYHVAGAEKLSRLEIGKLLLKRWPEIHTPIKSGLAKDFPGPPRALDTSLDVGKAQAVLNRPLPKFSAWLAANPQECF